MLQLPAAIHEVLHAIAAIGDYPSAPILAKEADGNWSVSFSEEFRIIYDEELDTLILWDEELEDSIGGVGGEEADDMVVALFLAIRHEELRFRLAEAGE